MQIGLTNILIILAISISAALSIFFLLLHRKKKSYDTINSKAILEEVRNHFEKQIYTLNDRLIQSEERWRDVNHLLLNKEYYSDKISSQNDKVAYSNFLRVNGLMENDLIIDRRLIFILTPFHDIYQEDYKVIKDICQSLGFTAVRGDETFFRGDIFPQMLKLIVKANLIIANINGRNPNVMYELGIAQAMDKSVLLLSKEPQNLPIDLKSRRFIIYANYAQLEETLRDELLNFTVKNE